MKQITVYKPNGSTVQLSNKNLPCTIVSARQEWTLNGDDLVKVTVKSAVALDLGIGDSVSIFGRTYKMNRLPKITKTKTHLLQYDCEFEGIQYDLMRVTYDLTVNTTSCQLQDIQADSLTGNLERFAKVLVANANRVFTHSWAVGTCPETDADRCLTFGESANCLSVLQQLCQEFKVEFDIVTSNGVNVINFKTSIGSAFPYTFRFGNAGGLYNLQRLNVDSSNIVTRLKVFGSTQNITTKYRANRLCLPGKSKGLSYLENTDAITAYGIFEATKYFDDIKPTFGGNVTSIVADNVLQFVDTGMFDLNAKDSNDNTLYLLPGISAKVHFNSGNLAGYEFDIHSYDHTTKTFTLCKQTDERGDQFPSASSAAFQIKAGDTYKLIDVALPDSYVEDAENLLEEKGKEYLATNCQPLVKYALSIAKAYLEELIGVSEESVANVFHPGDYIPIKDSDVGVNKSVRIQQISRNILDAYEYVLTISDTVSTSVTTRVISDIQDIQDIININNLKDPTRARANWRSSRELLNMVFDPEGDYYTDKIKPNSIDTLHLSVGAKSMQFGLVGTVFEPNFGGNKNSMKVTGGTLVHYTIDEQRAVSWTLANNTFTFQKDSDAFYIYAKCSRSTNSGVILFSTQQIACESDADYYHFWIGVLHAVDSETGIRDISLSYGFSMINGRYITTGRIQSADSKNYIDLDENKIRFGNESCYIDWNVTKNGQFSMRNVKIVSGSGDAYDMPIYRGDWNSQTLYYSGDTVTYSDGTTTATYMYINSTPSTGHAVTETAYWKVYVSGGAKGAPGKDGASIEVQFSVDGSSSWHSSFKSGDQYMRQRVGSGSWSSAIKIVGENGQDGTDGSYTSFMFQAAELQPAKPTSTSPIPSGWSDEPPVCDIVSPTYTGNWVVNGKTLTSNAIGHSDATWEKIQIVTTKANTKVMVRIFASSEDYDFGYICNLDDSEHSTSSYLAKVSGTQSALVTINIASAGTHFFYVGYTKDSSSVANDDKIVVKILDTPRTWMTCAVVSASGVAGTWATPVLLSGQDGNNGNDGQDGKDGKSPSSPYRGEYASTATYYGCGWRCDIVKYLGAYYRARPDAPQSPFVSVLPTNTSYWEQFGASYENIATGFLFASEAVIDNAVIRILRTAETGKRIIIQNNEMTMFDANNQQKLLVKGDNIDIGTPTASFPLKRNSFSGTYSIPGANGTDQDEVSICTFSVQASETQVQIPSIEITESESQSFYGGVIENVSIQIWVKNSYGQRVATLATSSWKGCEYSGGTIVLDAGNYEIMVSASWDWWVDPEGVDGNLISVTFMNQSTGNVVIASATLQSIQIGANGIAIHLGNSFSAVFALDNGTPTMLLQGLLTSGKAIGLSITQANGVQINRGSGWVAL